MLACGIKPNREREINGRNDKKHPTHQTSQRNASGPYEWKNVGPLRRQATVARRLRVSLYVGAKNPRTLIRFGPTAARLSFASSTPRLR